MKKGNKILDKEYSLFYVNLLELSLLQEKNITKIATKLAIFQISYHK